MQPKLEPVGDPRSNGAPPGAVAADTAERLDGGGAELQDLLAALQAMRVGDFSVRMAGNRVGLIGKIADTFNEIVAANERMAQQLERVGHVVGREGKTRQRVKFALASGASGVARARARASANPVVRSRTNGSSMPPASIKARSTPIRNARSPPVCTSNQ